MKFRPLTETYADAVTLPTNIDSISQPSKPIDRLLSRREKRHNSTINSIKFKCQKHSLEIEEEIRQESERLNENLTKIKNKLENDLIILRSGRDELLNLDVFKSVLATVQNDQRVRIIDDYYENLKILEKKRSKYFKTILNEGYRTASKISHLLPYELLNYFETEMTRMNEITMNNYSHYAKLHSDLKLQVQEEIRLHILEITDARDKYKMAIKMAKVKEMMDAHKAEETKLPMLNLANMEAQFLIDVPRTIMDVEMWSQKMTLTLDYLDANAKRLVTLFKMAVVHVFNRFFDELHNIMKVVTENEEGLKTSLCVDVNDEMYKSIIEDMTDLYKCDVAELQNLWDNITKYMESNINNTYIFLNSSAHLWDNHFNRVADIRNLILQDIKILIDKHDKASQKFDKKIHVTLDKLRQESTVPKLDKYLKEAYKFLDSIEQLYQKQCDAEIKLLEKYSAMIDQSIELLISEIDRFLSENADKTRVEEKKSWIYVPEEKPPEDSTDKFIPDQIKVLQAEVEAVNNWMFGLWEAIRVYMSTCHQELSEQAKQWIDKTTTKLKKRLEVRVATHKPRYFRIKTVIYDVRLKELEDHMNAYHEIQEKVQQYIGDSRRTNQTSNEDRMDIFKEYEENMRGIEERLKKASKSYHVASCIEQSKTGAEETRKKLSENLKLNYELLEKNLDCLKKLICNFGGSIQLFPEGGNYSPNEAKIYTKKIKRLKKQIPKKYGKVFAEFEVIAEQTLHNFEDAVAAILERMKLSKEEFDHNEAVCERMKDLRSKIRNYAYEVKFKIHRIDADIDYYEDVAHIGIWKSKHLDIMKDMVEQCVKNITEMSDFLIGGEDRSEGYLSELRGLINESYIEIENKAKGFYAKHGPVINTGKIQKSFGSFMEEVKKTYDGFGVQVEVHCLECIQELTRHALRFLKVNESLVEEFPEIGGGEELGEEAVKNEDRVGALHLLLVKMMDRVVEKTVGMEEFVQGQGEE